MMASLINVSYEGKLCEYSHLYLTLVAEFFAFSDWLEGMVTEYLVATFGDYFTDVKM